MSANINLWYIKPEVKGSSGFLAELYLFSLKKTMLKKNMNVKKVFPSAVPGQVHT